MDFDANCGFVYHYSERALEGLVCDSPLGEGRIRLAGDLPGGGGPSHFSVELDRIPVAAGLDALRTVRSGVGPDLAAAGRLSGKISYDETPSGVSARAQSAHLARSSKASPAQGPLTGNFTVEGFRLSGGGLSQPIEAPKLVLAPGVVAQDHAPALAGAVAVPMGGTAPLTVNVHLELKGYQVATRGQVSIVRGREMAHAVGISQASALNDLAGDPLVVDLVAEGPWLPAAEIPFSRLAVGAVGPNRSEPEVRTGATNRASKAKSATTAQAIPATDVLNGTVTVHSANWKADYLANHVVISEATLHVGLIGGMGDSVWDPVAFTYGPLKGTASFNVPGSCDAPQSCPTQFQVQFGNLDAATVQAAILGAREKGTLLSDLINKLRPSSAPLWPQLEGTVKADSLILGPITLKDVRAELHFKPSGAEVTSLDGELLGGSVHGTGTLAAGDRPGYALAGDFEKLNPMAVGQLLGETWRGGTFDANGTIDLSGYTGADLANSAKGTLHFEWRHGAVAGGVPPQLARFDRWTADAAIANGKIALGLNQIADGSRNRTVYAAVTLAEAPKLSFAEAKPVPPKKR